MLHCVSTVTCESTIKLQLRESPFEISLRGVLPIIRLAVGPKRDKISWTPPARKFPLPDAWGISGVRRWGARNPLKSEKSRWDFAIDFPSGRRFWRKKRSDSKGFHPLIFQHVFSFRAKTRVFVGFLACFTSHTGIPYDPRVYLRSFLPCHSRVCLYGPSIASRVRPRAVLPRLGDTRAAAQHLSLCGTPRSTPRYNCSPLPSRGSYTG
jgi:hypothetical protein